ncbi:hypothetical protein ACJIZ3_005654 [Penstemon smallii]|uniref:DUF4005 domain-containing protein n=1 Tax=Penstemon smallii TaxID=265156 RepID=A0ABD3S5N0_9LAMI
MGKKKSWFSYVKRLFIHQSKPKSEEKPKNWSWFFEKFKFRQYPALEEPQKTLNDATEEHRKHALAVAVATAAVAEAAMAAANAAAEVVRLTNIPYELERKNHYLSAIKIQSAYRGYLARKALSALRGIVKLQAVIRGELLRRRFIRKLASISLFLKPKPQVTLLDYLKNRETRDNLGRNEELKCNSDSGWDLSMVSKDAFYLRNQEAIAKRERMKQYSFSHRERRNDQSLQESITHRKSSRFDKCVELHSKTIAIDTSQLSQLKLRSMSKRETIEDFNSSFSLPRRSFCHVKQKSIGDDDESLPNSPVFPAYMAATESAKAKSRSLSTPRQRLRRLCDTYSDQNSPYKLRLSTWNSFNGSDNITKRNSISQQNLGAFH